jgi:asparagine synthase (glutamine-hydrolysing)
MMTLEGFRRRPYADRVALIDMLLELPERLLMRLDRATMRHAVEARVPFLDPEVLAAAFRVPPALRGASPKGFLRAYAERKLPGEVLRRAKVGFPTATTIFLAPPVQARIRERVLARPFIDFTGFAEDRVSELLARCERGGGGFAQIWSLYVLSLWFHEWV